MASAFSHRSRPILAAPIMAPWFSGYTGITSMAMSGSTGPPLVIQATLRPLSAAVLASM